MLALGEFSVSEVAALANVRESTVRTILRREGQYVERIGVQRTGRRGGQPVWWRVRPEARDAIRAILEKLEGIGAGPWLDDRAERDGPAAPPVGAILAAEDVLLRRVPAARDPVERAGLIKLARTQVETVEAAVAPPGEADLFSDHLKVVNLLLDLEEMEQSSTQSGSVTEKRQGWQVSIDLLLAAGRTQDKRLCEAVRRRVEASPLAMIGGRGRRRRAEQPRTGREPRIPDVLFARNFLIYHASPNYPKSDISHHMAGLYHRAGVKTLIEGMRSGRLFGTDGIRGVAGRDLSAPLAVGLAIAAARVLARPDSSAGRRPVAVIACDPSSSSQFLESAIIAGLTSSGVDVIRLGVAPAAAVAFLTARKRASLGVMLSASHSRAPYNGIKFFGRGGYKLPDAVEDEIEQQLTVVIDSDPAAVPAAGFGVVTDGSAEIASYITHVLSSLPGDPSKALTGLRIVADCANGAAWEVGPKLLRAAGAEVIAIGVFPDGQNINAGYGTTDPGTLIAAVREHRADAGIAYDGDADRCIAVDHLGRIIDGDQILAALSFDLAGRGKLAHRTVVATVMSNIGFRLAMQEAKINVVETPVGDRYIIDEMRRGGYVIGGEQSGRIIIADHATAPDGLLVSLNLLAIAARHNRTLADLADVMARHPQILVNVSIPLQERPLVASSEQLTSAVQEAAVELGQRGRIVLRPSGTEPVVRVMVEDDDHGRAERLARQLADTVRELV
jgi:phosphoglucosamine mutase